MRSSTVIASGAALLGLASLSCRSDARPAAGVDGGDGGDAATIDAAVDARPSDDAILLRPDPRRPWAGVVTPVAAVEALQFHVDDRTFPTIDLGVRSFVLDTRALADGEHWLGVDVVEGADAGLTTRWARIAIANGPATSPSFAGTFVAVAAKGGLALLASTALPRRSVASAGGLAADFDGDGALDLFAWGTDGVGLLLFQREPWRFTAGATLATGVSAAGAADLDGDGDPDLVTAGDDVRLFRNDDGVLVDATTATDFDSVAGGTYRGVTFADLDLDGLEDPMIARMDCSTGGASLVLHNEGALRFAEIGPSLGLDGPDGATYAFSADLDPDDSKLHVWTFREGCRPIETSHVTLEQTDGLPRASPPIVPGEPLKLSPMGSAWLDADADGHLDLYLSGDFFSPVWLGPRLTANAAPFFGLDAFAPIDGPWSSQWSMVLLDVDLDGRSDVFAVHDPSDPDWDDSGASDALYWQHAPGSFRDVATTVGLGGRRSCRSTFGADLDADGDVDLVTGCRDGVRVFRNDLLPAGSGRMLSLRGTLSPADGVHAWIRAANGRVVLVRGGGQPYAGGTSAASLRTGEALEVHWPSGLVQHVSADARGPVVEPAVVWLATRRVAPGASPVEVVIDPAAIGARRDAVTVELVGAAWERAPIALRDGLLHGSIRVPSSPGTITLHVSIAGVALTIHPRIYVRN